MNVLELFAGSCTFSRMAKLLGFDTFASDIKPFNGVDYVTDILNFDLSKMPFYPDIIWASPPCTAFSVASMGYHWKGGNKGYIPATEAASQGIRLVKATLEIIYSLKPTFFFIENPRGLLRKFINDIPRTTVMYCQYGDNRMKPTDIWSNNLWSIWNTHGFLGKTCYNNNKKCHHIPAPRGSRTGTQGLSNAYERSKIPEKLCVEILQSCLNG